MSGLDFYKVLFITELLVLEVLFMKHFPHRKKFALRLAVSLIVTYVAAIFYPVGFETAYTAWYSSVMFFVLFAISVAAMAISFRISFTEALFCSFAAYTVQHITYGVIDLIISPIFDFRMSEEFYGSSPLNFSPSDASTWLVIFIYLAVEVLFYGLSYIMLSAKLKGKNSLKLRSTKIFIITTIVLIADIVLNSLVLYTDSAELKNVLLAIYNILCCFGILYILISLIVENDRNAELERMSEAIRQAHKQYAIQKETIKYINIKCHDMKYEIARLMKSGDKDAAAELNDMISIYDSSVKTGNEVLDIILTEKSLVCNKNKIKLSCIADNGVEIKINDGDLYALFGNIIDNAIDAVSKIDKVEKRCINVRIRKINDFVSINVDNYFVGELSYTDDGLPVTTKANAKDHGFGIRSIKAITESYGGTLSVVTKKDVFIISLLFPV